jgi:FHA domain
MGMARIDTESAKLLVKLHGQRSRSIELTGDSFTIGRKRENDLPIDDHTVSSRHAKIVKVQSVYFLEDLKSTNGTKLNGRTIDRVQLHDADVITIGPHRLIFQDGTPPEVGTGSPDSHLDKTIAISQQQLPAAVTAKVLIRTGKTDRLEYHLAKRANMVGAQEGAAIRLTGWFAPKTAALISCAGSMFTISPSEGTKRLLVNGKPVLAQHMLKDGDMIEVAGVSMAFYVIKAKTQ